MPTWGRGQAPLLGLAWEDIVARSLDLTPAEVDSVIGELLPRSSAWRARLR